MGEPHPNAAELRRTLVAAVFLQPIWTRKIQVDSSHGASNRLRMAKSGTESLSPQSTQSSQPSSDGAKGRCIWSSLAKGRIPTQKGKRRWEPPEHLLLWGRGFQYLRAASFSTFLLGQGRLDLEPRHRCEKQPDSNPMGIIPTGMIPHWEPTNRSVQSIYNSLVQGRASGQRGERMGAASLGINHPYSNTPPQTSMVPQ